jgi:hypothetical protein
MQVYQALIGVLIHIHSTGKVAGGVLDTLKHLPIEWVKAEQLPSLVSNPGSYCAIC